MLPSDKAIGIWIAKGLLNWPNVQVLFTFFGSNRDVRANQEVHLPLAYWIMQRLVSNKARRMHAGWMWEAQQCYKIIQLLYSEAEQEQILTALESQKFLETRD